MVDVFAGEDDAGRLDVEIVELMLPGEVGHWPIRWVVSHFSGYPWAVRTFAPRPWMSHFNFFEEASLTSLQHNDSLYITTILLKGVYFLSFDLGRLFVSDKYPSRYLYCLIFLSTCQYGTNKEDGI